MDPLLEKRIWLSPYNYCQNNSFNRVDPDGMLDDEYDVIINEDGTETKKRVNGNGGTRVDYYNYKGGF